MPRFSMPSLAPLYQVALRQFRLALLALTVFSLACPTFAASLAQYPLRVHIFQRNEHTHYWGGAVNYVEGDGRANLFENCQPRGFDFDFRCSDRLMASSGFETYPAKWKKTGQTMEILYPVMGKPGSMHSCELKVDMKSFAYYKRSGVTYTEPVADFKHWMDQHQYDPEHGKDEPINPVQNPAQNPAPASPAPTQPTPQ